MKIVYIAHTSDWHGSSKALLNIVANLKNANDVSVILPDSNGRFYQELKNIGITVYISSIFLNVSFGESLQERVICRIKNFKKYRVAKKKLKNLLRKINPDIVHCNVGPVTISADVCKDLKIPHIWHIREYQDKDFGMHILPSKRIFLKKLSDLNNTCLAITKDIFKYWQLNTEKDKVVYDGVFSLKEVNFKIKNRNNYFLFVGRVSDAKGALVAIEAFKIFNAKHPDYKLLIVGEFDPAANPYSARCLRFCEDNFLTSKIIFLGVRTDVYSLMSEAQALIVPSKDEGFGFITVEGMLNCTPVIGRNTSGTKEQFDNGKLWTGEEIGYRFETTEELVKMMEKVIHGSSENLVSRAYQVVTGHYTIEKNIEKLVNIYKETIAKYEKK